MAKKKPVSDQVYYDSRWIPREGFRVYVYNEEGQKLVNSYDEYEKAIVSGVWYSNKESVSRRTSCETKKGLDVPEKVVKLRKIKHGAIST